ncbi:MAG: NAD-dependent epimerase/dehydratase family protein [Halobacteriales archaeon]
MARALVIGGTRFLGRHTVSELLEAGYDVTTFNRGNHPDPFADDDRVTWVEGDRTNDSALEAAAQRVDPSIVIDVVAYYPRDVRAATTIFADVDAYVYVSSGAVYAEETVPKREGETALVPCGPKEATDDGMETYGARKAEGDRAVFAAAAEGVPAMSVRPCIIYGPYDYTERVDYWLDRIATDDRVLVPGDGQHLWHRVYVKDVARALRIVAELGTPGEAYNVGDRRVLTLADWIERSADVMDRDIEIVTAGPRELAAGGLDPTDFVLYREYPHLLETAKLAALGWESTPVADALRATVAEHRESDRDGADHDPGREAADQVLEILDTL